MDMSRENAYVVPAAGVVILRENAYVLPGAGVDLSREKCLCGARSWCGHVERKMPMWCSELVWT